jgi:hypothetical protein
MDSVNPNHIFDPLDLEILDRDYEVALAHIEARDLYRSAEPDAECENTLRKTVFSLADRHPVDFDALATRSSLNIRPGA